jgi:voltage-gated potassium channel
MSLWKRLLFALALLLCLMAIATAGYRLLGGSHVSFLEALYMAVITLSGVGYGEIVDTSHNPVLRLFNMGVVLVGVAITVYVFSVVAAFIVEVEIANPFWRRRMQKRIDELHGHYIVCGLGDTGRHAVEELQKTNTPHLAIDMSEETFKRLKELHPQTYGQLVYVVGDATEEEVLDRAGIERARGLIAALPHDKENLVITVLVRQRFPKVRIVARSAEQKFSERILRAGANSTVSPSRIGGLRMASEIIRPHVVGFLDLMLREQSQTLRVEEVSVPAASPWINLAVERLGLGTGYNLLLLAVKKDAEGAGPRLQFNPPADTVISQGDALIVMGNVIDIQRARQAAGMHAIPTATS